MQHNGRVATIAGTAAILLASLAALVGYRLTKRVHVPRYPSPPAPRTD